jgi:hypothetical protein
VFVVYIVKMYTQYGGALPVYIGSRHQRGGGILSSIARFLMPAAKTLLTETVKMAPGVVDNILNKKQGVGSAIFGGLKKAGRNTAQASLNRLGVSAPRKKRRSLPARPAKRRKVVKKDVFS